MSEHELDPRRWKALTVVCAAFFMTVLDVSIVNVALPSIGKSLNFSRDNLQWVITAYSITFGGFLLLGGRAADLLGRRRVFLAGVVLFTIASFLCGLAWSEGVLVASRAVQGLGAAIISPAALSIVTTTFDEGAERNKALGIWGAIGGSGAAVGVLAGGVLTKYFGWEWIFFVNVPVGILAFSLAPRFVRESKSDRESSQDVAGAIAVTAGLALLVYAVSKAPDHGWASSWTILRLAVAAALLVAFLVIESRARDPLMPFRIFRVRTVAGANVAGIAARRRRVRELLPAHAVRAAGARLVGAAHGSDVHRDRRDRRAVGGRRAGARDAHRREAGDGDRLRRDDRRHALVHADPGARVVLVGSAPRLPAGRLRLAVLVHPRLDRSACGRRPRRGGLASGLINTAQQIGGAIGVAVTSSVSLSHFNHLLKSGTASAQRSRRARSGRSGSAPGSRSSGLSATVVLVRRDELATAPEGAVAAA